MLSALRVQLSRDLLLSFVKRVEWLNPLIFLILVQSLFPFALGADSVLLGKAAPAIIWVSALLSTLIGLDGLFKDDFDDGSLEQMRLSHLPFFMFSLSKLLSHWLVSGLPLVLACPILAYSFYLRGDALWVLVISLLLATPVLCCISSVAAALTLNAKRSGILLSLMILPLYVPILIFGSGAVLQGMSGESALGAIYMLAAICIFSITLTPFILSAALSIALNDA